MNRAEFLAELRAQLADFSEDAREDALKFYEEYLDEAGPENEAIVLAELGSPQKVARIIRANCDSGMPETGRGPARGAAQPLPGGIRWNAPRAPVPPRPDVPRPADEAAESEAAGEGDDDAAQQGAAPADAGTHRRPAYDYGPPAAAAYGADATRAGKDRTLWILLLIVTCPLWIGVFFGLVGGAFGLVGGMIGLFFGGLGTMIAGFAALGGGMGLLFSSVPNGILMIGVSLLCISCGAFLAALALWVTTKLVPLAMRAVRWLWHRLFGNGR